MRAVKSKVKLVAYTKDAEKLIAESARLCYGTDEEVKELFKRNSKVDSKRMIKILMDMEHLSPIEHPSYSFLLTGVSRALTHQLVRHRLASYSQRSQRYVKHKNFNFIIPETIESIGKAKEFRKDMESVRELYEKWGRVLEEELGLEGEANNQDARYVLPNACETKIITTMNARELLHFFKERLCNRAQWEIRGVAEKMLDLAYPTVPNLFQYAGPNCYSEGKCKQGKKSCGKLEQVVQHFENKKNRFK